MRIAYLSFSEIPSRSANSIHVIKMARSMAAAGHDVRLHAWGDSRADDCAFYGVPRTFEIIKSPRPETRGGGVIFTHHVGSVERGRAHRVDLYYGRHLASMINVCSLGVPLVYEAHAPPARRMHTFAEALLFRSANFARLVVISEALRAEYLRLFPSLRNTSVVVAHDGADLPAAVNVLEPRVHGRADALQCGYVGHLYEGRGIDVILEIARRIPTADFHLVGGTDDDIARWRSSGVPPNIHMHGFVPHSDVPAWLHRFDLVFAPYRSTGVAVAGRGDTSKWMSPLKIFEYMAHGKAIVCSDVPVLREVLQHEVNAVLVPPADHDAWEAAVRRLAADSNARRLLGTAARSSVAANFTWDIRARKVLEGVTAS